MRHRCRVPKLGRAADQRKALIRTLTTELLRYGEITTTLTRAKVIRSEAEKMITLAKDGTLSARRMAGAVLYDQELVQSLFTAVPERYGSRAGGYTRILRTVNRRGDNAPMAVIRLV
jgi:large subunit ribosomal protein L17